jgi:hypothetical protein
MGGRTKILAVCFALLPAVVQAQGSIAGLVRDSSGAVLPGVTVEAASPALIEKVRTAVTDGNGNYRIIDLVGGVYSVTFALPSFSTTRRDGIELIGSFTATVNAELRPGGLEEIITVSGVAPIVDVASPQRQQVLNREVITQLPVSRTYFGLAALSPGINVAAGAQDGGGINAGQVTSYSAYGGRLGEGRLLVDGISVGGSAGGSGTGYYTADVSNAQEVSLTLSGGLGEAETGGPVFNVIPRTGGNTLRGQFYYNYANASLQSDNRTDEILTLNPNLRKQDEIQKFQEINGSFGGPIRQDRLWYYWTGRLQRNDQFLQNIWFNKHAGDPTKWTYEPDYDRPGFSDRDNRNTSLRLTWQITSKQKVNIFWDEQANRALHKGGGTGTSTIANSSPEASATSNGSPQRVSQIVWQSPRTNRLLLEGKFNRTYTKYGNYERRDNTTAGLIRVTEQLQQFDGGSWAAFSYRSQAPTYTLGNSPRWEGLMSYVTGSHNVRVGYQGFFTMNEAVSYSANNPDRVTYRFLSGVPNQVTQYLSNPVLTENSRVMSQAVFVQDQWKRRRLTVGGALRFDFAKSWFPETAISPDRFLPQGFVFAAGESVRGFKDLSPRGSVAYDLFGDGKTALKVNVGRYLEAATNGARYTAQHPFNRLATSTTRSWTDANSNKVVDCNLNDLGIQDLRPTGGDWCDAAANQQFGQLAAFTTTYDDRLLEGWRVRPMDWQVGASIQQEVRPRVSVELAYNRRMYGRAPLVENPRVTSADYLPYTLVAPVDDRIGPASGRVLNDLFTLTQAARLLGTATLTRLPEDTERDYRYFHAFDINGNARMAGGLTLRGGVSLGRDVNDTCRSLVDNPSTRNCHTADPFQPRISALGVYTVPFIDVQFSGTFQSRPGAERSVTILVPVAQAGLPAGTFAGTTVSTNFLNPGEMYGERIQEIDLKIAKVLQVRGRRATAGFEIFNVTNSSGVLTYNNAYALTGTNNWGQPTGLVPPRYAKFSIQVDF